MKTLIALFTLFALSLHSEKIELFMDWASNAKGQEHFQIPEGSSWEQLSLPSKIRKRLLEKGWDIASWDRDSYRPWLIGWKQIQNFQEFKWRLGWALPEKTPFKDKSCWVFWSLGPKVREFDFGRLPKDNLILFMWEPPTVQPEVHDPKVQAQFGKIFTWDDDLVDNKRFFKFHYPNLLPRLPSIPSFDEKKFCTLIASRLSSRHPKELYSEREKAIRYFEDKPGEFDLYGRFWEKRNYLNYKGTIGDKLAVLKNYKFSICYENTRDVKGYITEKILDCFAAGSVPVYWGASNVTDYIPEGCFVDRRKFENYDELYAFMKNLTQEEYGQYLKNAEEFLKSEKAQVFTQEHFIKTFLQIIEGPIQSGKGSF